MPVLQPKLEIPLSSKALPAPIMFRSAHVPADGLYPLHRHAWGEFVYAFSGVMEVKLVDGRHFLAPPQYGIWLPPDVEHIGANRLEAYYCSLYVARAECETLPRTACALTVNPLVRAMLHHLRQHAPDPSARASDMRLMQVLVDQLACATRANSYLPHSDDALVAPLLQALYADPADNRSLAEFARDFHTTERTLARRCMGVLGMSLADWRQRLRVVKALPRLESGHKVESIALDLGYSSASAFIAMFRRLMDVTPDEFRRSTSSAGLVTQAPRP